MSSQPLVIEQKWLFERSDCLLVHIFVSTRAAKTRIMGIYNDRLKIQVAAIPVDAQTNTALVKFLATALHISAAQVKIIAGLTSKNKTVQISGMSFQRVLVLLTPRMIRS